MNPRNNAFFSLFENFFLTLKKHYDEPTAISLFQEVMETGLGKAYGTDFIKGNPNEFCRIVGERDNNVGLPVEFPEIDENKIVYQFHEDPFPGLKGHVASAKLDATYIPFKISYLLGDEWQYKTTKHFWNGDSYIEHVLYR